MSIGRNFDIEPVRVLSIRSDPVRSGTVRSGPVQVLPRLPVRIENRPSRPFWGIAHILPKDTL